MNNTRRKELRKALEYIALARDIIESVTDEEQEAFDNMPEGIQQSERGEAMEEMISIMSDAYEALEDVDEQITGYVIEA